MDFVLGFLIVDGAEAVLSKTVASPFERIRLLQQTLPTNPKMIDNISSKEAFGTIRSSLTHIWREEGYRGFWRGNMINCVSFYARTAFRYGLQDEVKLLIPHINFKVYPAFVLPVQLITELLVAGALVSVIHPLELCRTRLATDTKFSLSTATTSFTSSSSALAYKYKGFVDCFQQVLDQGGLRAMYRGFLPATLGMFQFRQGIKLCDSLQKKSTESNNKQLPFVGNIDVSSGIGKVLNKSVIISQSVLLMIGNLAFVYPLDTIARRMKIDDGVFVPSLPNNTNSNTTNSNTRTININSNPNHISNTSSISSHSHSNTISSNVASNTTQNVPYEGVRVYRSMHQQFQALWQQNNTVYDRVRCLYRGFLAASVHTCVTYSTMLVFALCLNSQLQAWYLQHRIEDKFSSSSTKKN